MNDIITTEDMIAVTGYEQSNKQCQVLDRHGIFYIQDKNGCPKTTWYNFNHPCHLRPGFNLEHNGGYDEPDFQNVRY